MKKRTLLLLLSLLPLSMTAQQKFLLRGQVVDAANDSPVSFATTALLRDSTAVAAVAADAQGRFELSAEAAGDYRLQITMVGYNPETQPVTLRTAATDAGTIRLRQGVDIDQVTVTIQKPLVTADAEKTTYSVEDDPQAASIAMSSTRCLSSCSQLFRNCACEECIPITITLFRCLLFEYVNPVSISAFLRFFRIRTTNSSGH